MVYKCLRCNKDFLNKTHFKNHLMRKKKCIIEYRNIECSELLKELEKNNYQNYFNIRMKDHKCDFCNNFYKHKSNMIRHRNKCKYNPELQECIIDEDLDKLIIDNSEIEIDKKNHNIVQNITNNITQNIVNNITINNVGDENFDVSQIYKKLNFETDPSNFRGIKYNFQDRVNNYIDNFNIIFDDIYENKENHNFTIVNKKKKICKIKSSDDESKHIHFEDLSDIIFNIIDNIYNLSIKEHEINNDKDTLEHYRKFKKDLIERHHKFKKKYYSTCCQQEKKNIYDSLYQYYKGFRDILNNTKNKIFVKAYDIDF
jgi:hypothetical protein